MLSGISVDIMMTPNGLPQFIGDDHAWPFGAWATREQHYPRAGIRERCLEKADGNTEGHTRTPQRSLVVRDRPWIPLESLQNGGKRKLDLRDWEQEPGGTVHLLLSWWHSRAGRSDGSAAPGKAEHVRDLLRRVLFRATEYVGFAAVFVAEFVKGCHCAESDQTDEGVRG